MKKAWKKLLKKLNFKGRSKWEIFLTIVMFFLVAIFALGVSFFGYIVISAPNFDPEVLYKQEASIIYDVYGNEVKKLGAEKRENVSYDELPEVFIDALIATEDSRFFAHGGVDLARFMKATFGQLVGQDGAGGASTLTMQVAKQSFTSTESTGIKGIVRKFTDIYLSVFKLEKKYTKEQIIEFYVNTPYLGSGSWGIEQACQVYFSKPASELTLPEAALIAGLFQAPHSYDPYRYPDKAESRRNTVLNLMLRHGYITQEEYDMAKALTVEQMLVDNGVYADEYQGVWDTIIQEVIDRTGYNPNLVSMRIYSTIDMERQAVINKINDGSALTGDKYKYPKDNLQVGIAVIDVKTGGIAAIGAGRNKKGELSFNYATMTDRHPGSTAKPIFDYGPALEYLNWSTGQMTIDEPHTYSDGKLSVKNHDNSYDGVQTIKVALASSRNVPALKTFQALKQSQINEFVTGLGIRPEYDANYFINESHSIGGFTGVSPVELSAAYATFARGGIYIEPHSFTKVEFVKTGETYKVTPEKRTVMKDSTAYMINMMLKYAVTGGYINAGSKSGTDIASKTGTSTVDSAVKKQYGITASIIGDSWQVVYSPDYTCATWVGYDRITSTQYLTNSVGQSTRRAVSRALTSGIFKTNSTFKRPSSVVTAEIELETNPLQLASEFTPAKLRSTEYFRKGTVPESVSPRFSKLSDPSNLSVSYTDGSTYLSWDGINTPDVMNTTYLSEYFLAGWGKDANKYYNQRLTYNNNSIGRIGYQVYVTDGGNTKDLGWTEATNFRYYGSVSSNATFTVKSSYSIFKSNMSDGVSASASGFESPNQNWSLETTVNTCMTINEYNSYNASNISLARIVLSDGSSLNATDISKTCWDSADNEVTCSSMSANNNYSLSVTARYNGQSKSVLYRIRTAC